MSHCSAKVTIIKLNNEYFRSYYYLYINTVQSNGNIVIKSRWNGYYCT